MSSYREDRYFGYQSDRLNRHDRFENVGHREIEYQ